MKLIDLLVQEFPKSGGWPDGALSITQDNDGSLCVWDTNDPHYDGFSWKHHTGNSLMYFWHGIEGAPLSCDHNESIVTYWQYKAALSASQKPAWNGEGLPPVGCECEVKRALDWVKCKILFISDTHVILMADEECCWNTCACQFRPLRTKAERVREDAETAMRTCLAGTGSGITPLAAKGIYEAIAAGKIPGVKLDD